MLDQRRRRWADVVQMLYKCFVFAVYTTRTLSFQQDISQYYVRVQTTSTFLYVRYDAQCRCLEQRNVFCASS